MWVGEQIEDRVQDTAVTHWVLLPPVQCRQGRVLTVLCSAEQGCGERAVLCTVQSRAVQCSAVQPGQPGHFHGLRPTVQLPTPSGEKGVKVVFSNYIRLS